MASDRLRVVAEVPFGDIISSIYKLMLVKYCGDADKASVATADVVVKLMVAVAVSGSTDEPDN
jgi:hypothetical protein